MIHTTGTHDIVHVTIRESTPLTIQAEYILNSRASGGLFLFMLIGGGGNTDIDFSNSAYIFLNKSSSLNYALPFQLLPGNYFIFAYDIEENGLICSGMANPAYTTVNSLGGHSLGI